MRRQPPITQGGVEMRPGNTRWPRIAALCRDTRGQALVEFALSSIVYFMTLFGTIAFGLAVYQNNIIADLAQEGARWASVRGSMTTLTQATNSNVQTYVQSRAPGMTVSVTTTWPSGGSPANAAGNRVRVRVSATFRPFSAIIPNGAMTLQSTAEMIIAR